MSSFSLKQNQPQQRTSSDTASRKALAHSTSHHEHPILNLQRTIGNQAVLRLMRAGSQAGEAASARGAAGVLGSGFARIPVSSTPARAIQTKLTVNTPGDAYEQEADRVADQVMRMPAPQAAAAHETSAASVGSASGIQRACACGGTCDDCKHAEETDAHVQMKAAGPASTGGIEAPPIVHEVLRSPGQPLDASTRAFMEPRFGHDFSGVRVHTDDRAAESANAVQARAYAVERNVIFGAGQYAPATQSGRQLLSHELTHVVQQGGSPGSAAQLQRQPAPQTENPRKKAIRQHEEQQRNVATLLDEARGWRKDFDKLSPADKLYLNTIELLDNQKMALTILTPTDYSDPQNPTVYFDDLKKYPNVGGDYPDNPKHLGSNAISRPGPTTRGLTRSQPPPQQTGLVPTVPPKVETIPGEKEAPPPATKARPQTPPVLNWIGADVRLFLDTDPISQTDLRNVFVHEGQHVADLSYLKNPRLDDWQSMLELYKTEFRAFWLEPPIGRACRDCPVVDPPFPDDKPIKDSDQGTVTIDANRKCTACPTPAGTKPAARSMKTKLKNARQQGIFDVLVKQYQMDEFDCFYVCNKDFRDGVNAFDLPAGENFANSVRLVDLRLELQKLIPDMTAAEVKQTKFTDSVKGLNDMDWAFLKDTKLSNPLWQLIKGFAPKPIYDALTAVAGKKNPAKEAPKALDDVVKKMK